MLKIKNISISVAVASLLCFVNVIVVIFAIGGGVHNYSFDVIDYFLIIYPFATLFIIFISSLIKFSKLIWYIFGIIIFPVFVISILVSLITERWFLGLPFFITSLLWFILFFKVVIVKDLNDELKIIDISKPIFFIKTFFHRIIIILVITILLLLLPFLIIEISILDIGSDNLYNVINKNYSFITEKQLLNSNYYFQNKNINIDQDPNWHYFSKSDTITIKDRSIPFEFHINFVNGRADIGGIENLLNRDRPNVFLPHALIVKCSGADNSILIDYLKDYYNVTSDDYYEHSKTSYKRLIHKNTGGEITYSKDDSLKQITLSLFIKKSSIFSLFRNYVYNIYEFLPEFLQPNWYSYTTAGINNKSR
ncbi:MAG: hypothetical protein HQ510_03870 [Candidatus Marinimicrobia bacterium]|nr:hypothetical protein [Candidatus Neomarinimicrobiota bacterium]